MTETRENTEVRVYVDGTYIGQVWRYQGYEAPPKPPDNTWYARITGDLRGRCEEPGTHRSKDAAIRRLVAVYRGMRPLTTPTKGTE